MSSVSVRVPTEALSPDTGRAPPPQRGSGSPREATRSPAVVLDETRRILELINSVSAKVGDEHGKRIKVSVGDVRVVVQLPSSLKTIDNVMKHLSDVLALKLGKPRDEFEIIELCTGDGFEFDVASPASILQNNELIIAKDQSVWMESQLEYLRPKGSHSLVRSDAGSEQKPKVISVGYHAQNKLFVLIRNQYDWPSDLKSVKKLVLADIPNKDTFKAAGKVPICSYRSEDNWYAEAYWIVEKKNTSFVSTQIELHCKSTTDMRATIELISWKFNIDSFEWDNIEIAQKSFGLPAGFVLPKLPPNSKTGPTLDEVMALEKKLRPAKAFEGNQSTGKLPFVLEQIRATSVHQNNATEHGMSPDSTFLNFFNTMVRLSSTGSCIVTKVTAQYKNLDGTWVDCHKGLIGVDQGRYGGNQFMSDPLTFEIGPDTNSHYILQAQIRIRSMQKDRKGRIHASLPKPLSIRYMLTSNDDRTCSLEVEVNQAPLELRDEAYCSKSEGKSLAYFQYLDDTNLDFRMYCYCKENKDCNRMEIRSDGSNGIYITEDTLLKIKAEAEKSGELEIYYDDYPDNDVRSPWKEEPKGAWYHVFFYMIDPTHKLPYAIHHKMKTTTGSLDFYYPINYAIM